jgi:hypothetical protein
MATPASSRRVSTATIRLIANSAVLCLVLVLPMENAMAQNTMGPIYDNRGIITQGQTGNNTINVAPPRDAAGVYQGDLRVGKVDGPTINEAASTISFQALVFNEFPDPNKPLEYGNLLLSCENIPQKEPNTFVGTLSAMIAGAQCRIIGKK